MEAVRPGLGSGNFGRLLLLRQERLHQELGVPVGLIQQAYAGTPIEGWMPWEIQTGRSSRPGTQRSELDAKSGNDVGSAGNGPGRSFEQANWPNTTHSIDCGRIP